ncbi:beta-lactamase/transpeptidase-like protein [Thozetella sp. PMI_491]|nr:beta-lactamase/transpeptidase-like protein [Thozetella sp. PMI_491]
MPDPNLLGRWFGCYDGNKPESFMELVVAVGSGEGRDDKWTLLTRTRVNATNPQVKMVFLPDGRFEASVPHWILPEPHKIRLQGNLRHSQLDLRLFGLGMSGLEDITSPVAFSRSLKAWEPFLRPLDPQKSLPAPPFDELTTCLLEHYSASLDEPTQPRVDALTITRAGETVFEEAFWGNSSTTLHMVSSCTKSITSILAGIAIDQGLFSLDDQVVNFFPWISETTWGEEPPILVRHVLSMTSGTFDEPSRSETMLLSTDVEEFVLGAKRECDPGTRFQYDNGLPCLMGCIIERTSKIPLRDFAEKYLFRPLGIEAHEWARMRPSTIPPPSASNPIMAAGGLYLGLDSMLKLGHFLSNMGVYNSQRILSEAYIKIATSQQTPSHDYPYGFYFHINTPSIAAGRHIDLLDGYLALGQGEQFIFVSPQKKIVISGFSSSWHRPKRNRLEDGAGRASYRVFDLLSETIVTKF